MNLQAYEKRSSTPGRRLRSALIVAIVSSWLLAGCGAAVGPAAPAGEPSPAPTATARLATAAQVEEQYGVQVSLVALTAANGLVDCRFRVLDPAKADFLLKAGHLPVLIVEKSNTVIQIYEPIDQDGLLQGRVYSVVYPNVNNALEPGDQVSLVIGDLRLEHLTVQ